MKLTAPLKVNPPEQDLRKLGNTLGNTEEEAMRYVSVAFAVTLYTCFVATSASAQTSRTRVNVRAQTVQAPAPYVVRDSFRETRCADLTCPNFILIGVGF